MRFREGERVRIRPDIEFKPGWTAETKRMVERRRGTIVTIKRIDEHDNSYLLKEEQGRWFDDDLEPLSAKPKRRKKDKGVRFIVHGVGCSNWTEMLMTEEEMVKKMLELTGNSNWVGRIVGYKLTPQKEVITGVTDYTNE